MLIASTLGDDNPLIGTRRGDWIFIAPGRWVNDALLVKGRDFNCNATICFGIDSATQASFKKLQAQVNGLAVVSSITPITVDGFIGHQTVQALRSVVGRLIARGALDANAMKVFIEAAGAAREQVASMTPKLNLAFDTNVGSVPSAISPSNIVDVAFDKLKSFLTPSGSTPSQQAKSRLPWIGVGVLSVAALGGIGYLMFYKSK